MDMYHEYIYGMSWNVMHKPTECTECILPYPHVSPAETYWQLVHVIILQHVPSKC